MGSISRDEGSCRCKSCKACEEALSGQRFNFLIEIKENWVPRDGIAEGFLRLIVDHKAQLCSRNVTVKKTPDRGPGSKQELEHGKWPLSRDGLSHPYQTSPDVTWGHVVSQCLLWLSFPTERGLIYSKIWSFGGFFKMVLSLSKNKSRWKHYLWESILKKD